MSKAPVLIDIDDLGIDTCNIREGKWDYDEEFVRDIKENGILNPLLVRPATPETGVKYAIVCGSRRYNAALEAGFTKVPCFIEEMDDVTALGRTVAENKHRTDIPAWRFGTIIGQMYRQINDKATDTEKVKVITTKTGLTDKSIRRYLAVGLGPEEVIELMKKPEDRSSEAKELLKAIALSEPTKTLDLEKASVIAKEFEGYPKEKIMDVAAQATTVSQERIREFVDQVKMYPKLSAREVYEEKVLMVPKPYTLNITPPVNVCEALNDAAVDKQMDRNKLAILYITEGLKRDGYL